MSHRPLWKRIWYDSLRVIVRLVVVLVCGIRGRGREHIPKSGGALVLSNHQSHLDPVIIGSCFNGRLNYVARDTLFGFAPFRWLIESLDAIPIDREGMGLSGIKETLRRLKREEMVLLFPEGTRTEDGWVAPLKPGFCALARRAKVPLLPVALDGSFTAWPRWQKYPRRAMIQVQIGEPIWPEQVAKLTDDELVAEVQRRLVQCHEAARRGIERTKSVTSI
jgi:1-acyl-sn-glycerol-3-phosphate acyltransferase